MTTHQASGASMLIGSSTAMRQLRALIERVAASSIAVLVEGPTGSGKELVARALHEGSGRRGAFVAVNVCAISETMFEAALFGHVRGAFTGAVQDSRGLVAEANGGTLFLDEIGGLPLASQAKLLRVLESKEFRPVGARSDQRSDFRVVAATNEPLARLVGRGTFRQDLAERLAGFTLTVAALAERRADIPELVACFARAAASAPVSIPGDAMASLIAHDWPGNVRELRHTVERILLRSADPGRPTWAEVREALRPLRAQPVPTLSVCAEVVSLERRRLEAVLDAHGWDTATVAAAIGVHRATVYRRMQRLGLAARQEPGARDPAETRVRARR
jgi:DNA-binding NtrC family response regulator